ncbi:MAG: hypothetical protein KGK16_14905 [Bradyrhizobium sp.]|nr:hypothetical protein [Bradyrhizobium sp.]
MNWPGIDCIILAGDDRGHRDDDSWGGRRRQPIANLELIQRMPFKPVVHGLHSWIPATSDPHFGISLICACFG